MYSEKVCTKCKELKSASEFTLCEKAKSGLQSQCKKCKNLLNKSQKKKDADARWKIENKDKVKIQCQKYYAKNKEKVDANSREFYLQNRDKQIAKAREWQDQNLDRYRAICKFNATKRDRLIAGQKIAKTHAEGTKKFYENCPEGMEVDHILPLRGKLVSGLHIYWNMQYLTPEENLKKATGSIWRHTMNLYNAGIYTASFSIGSTLWERLSDNEKFQRRYAGDRNVLESFHYIGKPRYVEMLRKDNVQVFLDSGAFSAWSLGAKVDIEAYCRYIQENEDIIRKDDGVLLASVMDGIGDPLLTWQNQLKMEKLGVQPLACFHYNEDPRYLEWYVNKYEYITLGGMVAQSTEALIPWLDHIWEKYLTDGSGRPRIKVHGFGLTTPKLMRRYPWWSVDSSSWVQVARTGGVLMLPSARAISVSNQSPSRRVEGQHIDTLPEVQRKAIEASLESHGVDIARMRENYLPRWTYNLYAYAKLGEIISDEKKGDPRFVPIQEGLFS